MSLNFLPPLLNADPPFHVWTSDEETSMAPYCVEEVEDQWLHPWFRVNSVTPHALAFCPSLLKLLRLKLFLSPLYDNDHEIHNSYQIVSRNGPRALWIVLHHDQNVPRHAQRANGDRHRRLERGYMLGGLD